MQPCPVTAKFDNFAGVQIFQNYTSPGGELAACKQYISWLAGGARDNRGRIPIGLLPRSKWQRRLARRRLSSRVPRAGPRGS